VVTTLVTGASGFIGSAVVRRLLAEGQSVRALVRPGSDRRNLDGLPVEIAIGDLARPATLKAAAAGCGALYHVAADYRLWVPKPEVMYQANVEGTRTLLLAAAEAGVARIVYTSSVAVLGPRPGGEPADETAPARLDDMVGHYKRSKFLAEQAVRELIERHGLPVVIVQPTAPVGPRDVRPTPTGRMILEAARGRMPGYVDTGLNLVHVDDVAEGHRLAGARGRIGERYILGGENLTLAHILGTIARLSGRRPPRFRIPYPAALSAAVLATGWGRISGREPFVTLDGVRMSRKRMFFTAAKAGRELGFCSRPAEDAIADALGWFRRHGYLS
jgi:dihydroflavonol-4-reductase